MTKQELYDLKKHYNILLNNISKHKEYSGKNILIVLKEYRQSYYYLSDNDTLV